MHGSTGYRDQGSHPGSFDGGSSVLSITPPVTPSQGRKGRNMNRWDNPARTFAFGGPKNASQCAGSPNGISVWHRSTACDTNVPQRVNPRLIHISFPRIRPTTVDLLPDGNLLQEEQRLRYRNIIQMLARPGDQNQVRLVVNQECNPSHHRLLMERNFISRTSHPYRQLGYYILLSRSVREYGGTRTPLALFGGD